jgi:hypothetical protein
LNFDEEFDAEVAVCYAWDNDIRLFGLKIVKDVVRTFLKEAASTVLPPDLLYSDGNHVDGIFHRFHVFRLQQLF